MTENKNYENIINAVAMGQLMLKVYTRIGRPKDDTLNEVRKHIEDENGELKPNYNNMLNKIKQKLKKDYE